MTDLTSESILRLRSSVRGQGIAAEVLAMGLAELQDEAALAGFWAHIRGEMPPSPFPRHSPLVMTADWAPVMTDDEARAFEREHCRTHAHYGTPNGDVPIDYLVALHEMNVRLGRYLRSRIGQQRQDEGT